MGARSQVATRRSPAFVGLWLAAAIAPWTPGTAATVSGVVARPPATGGPVAGARVTVFTPDLSFFRETRSGAGGEYAFAGVPAGTYRLGCCARGLEYEEVGIAVDAADLPRDFTLGPETEPGRWEVIGNTAPEFLDATDIGLLLADGTVFYCHDTTDPIRFDPATGLKTLPTGSGSAQGCMNGSLLPDGNVLMAGGQDGEDPGSFRNAVRWVKEYAPSGNTWQGLAPLQIPVGRWYPGLARLADGSFLLMGGGTAPSAARTETCERFDLPSKTWSWTGSMLNPTEFPPSALLFTGEVLATWWPPQLYNPQSGQWRATGNFVQPNRWWPGHSDHSLVVLHDGRALAVGTVRGPDNNSVMGEIYDPASETWSLTSNPDLVRYQTEVVPLPDGRVLAAGGETEVASPPVPAVLGIVRWCDLYDPQTDSWRRVADMGQYREYHAVSLLLPDGRVATTGGTRIKFQVGPTSSDIEAFVPPYLLRGVRPQIAALTPLQPQRGQQLQLGLAVPMGITSVVVMGTGATTHWVDSGVPRRLVLPAQQQGATVTCTLPSDPNVLPLGYYLVFAMVDDIPSPGVIVRVDASGSTDVAQPRVSPALLRVLPAVPNPFNPQTSIRFQLTAPAQVQIAVHDVAGRRVRLLTASRHFPAGEHHASWDGTDDARRPVASGVYRCTIDAGTQQRAVPLVLAR